MNARDRSKAWKEDQYDPDNWIRIPEFGVMPGDVCFEGFAFPIVDPSPNNYELRKLLREQVRTIRSMIRHEFNSQREMLDLWMSVLDLSNGNESAPLPVSVKQRAAAFYSMAMMELEFATRSSLGTTVRETRGCITHMLAAQEMIALWGDVAVRANESLRSLVLAHKQKASQRGRRAAEALHSRPGGSREKRDEIRRLWATGKYSDRDHCAEQECAALCMSLSAARKALRNTPNPPVWPGRASKHVEKPA